MATRSTPQTWGSVARAFHWLSALAVIGLLCYGYWMTHFTERGLGRQWHFATHGLIAIYFGLFLLLRLIWRAGEPTPALPAGGEKWEPWTAHMAHALLYLLMIGMLVTGYLMWSYVPSRFDPQRAAMFDYSLFGVIKVPAVTDAVSKPTSEVWEHWHVFLSHLLEILVALHILGALWHQFFKGDNVLGRMTSGRA